MNKPKAEVMVGLFVVIGFVILSMIVFFVSGVYFFRAGYHLRASFDYVGIINRGAPVRFAGVRVGEVTDVKVLPADGTSKDTKVALDFFVEQGVVVKDNYTVSIWGNHIMSEPHIEITPMPGEGRLLKDGDMVKGVSPYSTDEMLKQLNVASGRVSKMIEETGKFFDDSKNRQMVFDSFKHMQQLLASMDTVISGQEKELRGMISRLSYSTDQMGKMMERINKGEGTLGKLINEDEIYNDLRDFVKDIKTHPWRLFKK